MVQRPMHAFEPVGSWFAMAVGAQKVNLWKFDGDGINDRKADGELVADAGILVGLVAVDGDQLVTVHETGSIVSWDMDSIVDGDPQRRWSRETEMIIREVAIHQGRSLIAVGGDSGQLGVGRVDGGDEGQWREREHAHGDRIEELVFSAEGEVLASSGRDREIAIWSISFDDGQSDPTQDGLNPVRRLQGSEGWPLALSFSDDGRRLSSGGMDNGVYIWDLEADGDPLQAVRFDHHGWVTDLAFANDDVIVTASWDCTSLVLTSEPLQPIYQFMYHDDYVVSVLPVPNTTFVMTGSYDGEISVWDWEQGRLEAVLEGHGDWVTDLVWLGNERVVSLSTDRSARLWSVSDFSLQAVFGQPRVGDFDFEIGLDLASFGLGDRESAPALEEGRDLAAMQSQVVRRFEGQEAALAAGSGSRALEMLDRAVEVADDIDADALDDELDMDLDSAEAGEGLGDELSDMVLDAISDAEDEEDAISDAEDEEQDADLEAPPDEGPDDGDDPGLESVLDGPDRDEPSDPTDLLDPPDIETAQGSQLESSSPVVEERDDGETSPAQEFSNRPSSVDADQPLDGASKLGDDGASDVDRAQSFSEQSMPEVQNDADGLGIMDSVFDPAIGDRDGAADGSSAAEEVFQEIDSDVDMTDSAFDSIDEVDEAASEVDEEASDEPFHRSTEGRDKIPTSGPLYDPQPLKDDDEIEELLPDDEMLDLAFSSSFAEFAEPEVDDGGQVESEFDEDGAVEGKLDENGVSESAIADIDEGRDTEGASKAATDSESDDGGDESDGDSPVDGDLSDEKRGPPGKVEPSSATATATESADDGMNTQWERSRGSTTLTRGKPLTSTDSASSGGNEAAEDGDGLRDHRHSSAVGQGIEKGPQIGGDAPVSDSLVEKGNQTLSPFTTGSEADSSPFVVDDEPSSGADEPVKSKKRSLLKRLSQKLGDQGDRSDRGGAEQTSVSAPKKEPTPGKNDDEGTAASGASLRVKSDTPMGFQSASSSSDLGDEPMAGAVDEPPKTRSMQAPDLSMLNTSSQGRLRPGESDPAAQVQIPDPGSRQQARGGGGNRIRLNEVPVKTLWDRATATAPKMGVLKRRLSATINYEPFQKRNTGHHGAVCLAISPNQKRLVTAGEKGEIQWWNLEAKKAIKFRVSDAQWRRLGFVEGESFIYALDGRGRIFLWLLPQAVLGKVSQISYAVIDEGIESYRSSCLSDDGQTLLTGNDAGQVHLWKLSRGTCIAQLTGHQAPVTAATFGRRGPITASTDGQIRFWNHQGMQIDQVQASSEVCDLAAGKGNLVWIERSGALSMMAEGGSQVTQLQGHHGEGRALMMREDGHFVSGGEDGRLLVYGIQTGELKQEVHIPAPVQQVACKPRILAAACAGSVVFVFRRTAKKES